MTDAEYSICVEKYIKMVYRIAFHYFGSREEAEDITQHVKKQWNWIYRQKFRSSFPMDMYLKVQTLVVWKAWMKRAMPWQKARALWLLIARRDVRNSVCLLIRSSKKWIITAIRNAKKSMAWMYFIMR